MTFLSLVLLGVIARSGRSTVIVCNKTGASIQQLEIAACGQSRRFTAISDRESVQLELPQSGIGGEIVLSVDQALIWHGEYLEPGGGYHVSLHLQRGGGVNSSITQSAWQRLLQPFLNPNL